MRKKWICLVAVISMLFSQRIALAAELPENWQISDSQYYDGLRYVHSGGKNGYIDMDGNIVLPIEYDVLSAFNQGLAILAKNGKYGYVDNQGNIVVPLEYDEAVEFHYADGGYTPVCRDGRWGYLKNPLQATNPDGTPIIHWIDGADRLNTFHDGYAIVVRSNTFSLINRDFEEIWGGAYDYIEHTSEDNFFIVSQYGKKGVVRYDGTIIIPVEYDEISIIQMEPGVRRFLVVKDKKSGIFNFDGSVMLACVFSDLQWSTNPRDFVIAAYDGKWGILNVAGEELVPFIYDEIAEYGDRNCYLVKLDGKFGILNGLYIEILPPVYEEIQPLYNGMQPVKLDGLWGYVDENGIAVIAPQFDSADMFLGGIAVVSQNGKYGCINKRGQFVIPAEYDSIDRPYNREGTMEKDGEVLPFYNPLLLDYQTPNAENYIILQIGNTQVYTGEYAELDAPPVIQADRTLLPLRAVVEKMGGSASWNDDVHTAEFVYQDKTIILQPDNAIAVVNGEEKTLDVPPAILNDRTMMPLRFVLEQFGADVQWDDVTQKITIIY